MFASLRDDRFLFLIGTAALLIVRTVEPEIYHQFVNGKVSDQDVIQKVLAHYDAEAPQENRGGAWFEVVALDGARPTRPSVLWPLFERGLSAMLDKDESGV